jgi:uncharacterized DUF497 family protein
MILVWLEYDIQHMWERHQITPEQAEEVLDDPYLLAREPDPTSRSGETDRYIGEVRSLDILALIVLNVEDGERRGINCWPASRQDRKEYNERKATLEK